MEASKKSKICDFGGVKVQNLRFSPVYPINRDVAFVVHIHVGIVAVVMYKEYKVNSYVDGVVL